MSKKDKDLVIVDEAAALDIEALEKAVERIKQNFGKAQPLMLPMGQSGFQKARQHNKDRFLKYCHNGTILKQGTSGVEWEVLGVEQRNVDVSTSNMAFDYEETVVKMRSLKGGQKTGKKYTKNVSIENFHRYDIIDVPPAVKVLWGDPKDNPPKGSEDFEDPIFRDIKITRLGTQINVEAKIKLPQPLEFVITDIKLNE